jgi:hypothetical protein
LSGTVPSSRMSYTSDSLLDTDFPAPRWVVEGLLSVGLATLCGRPKAGKSWMALQLAYAVASGQPFLGYPTTKGKVIYYALEDYPPRIKARMETQGWGRGIPVVFKFSLEGGFDEVVGAIAKERPLLTIIDTFARATKSKVKHDDVGSVTDALDPLQASAFAYDSVVLTLDHLRKASNNSVDWLDDIINTTGKTAVPDTIWGLYRERSQSAATLRATGRDIGDQKALSLAFDQDSCLWVPTGEGNGHNSASKQRVLESVKGLGGRATTTEIASHTGMHKANVSRELAELVQEGKLKQGERKGRETPYELA